MANLSKTKTLFAFTSPRTIEKIIPEIQLLTENFTGQRWNTSSQIEFFRLLFDSGFYEGQKPPLNISLAARDRITRAPKALGFVDLQPTIQLTKAGQRLITNKRIHETITRQILKFQLPSPYHPLGNKFFIKPYLELLRLIKAVDSLSKTEIALFFTQLTHINKFDEIVQMILEFRSNAKSFKGSRKSYAHTCFEEQIKKIFQEEIAKEEFKTRESSEVTLHKFIQTKRSNFIDYADAFIRYLRATQLITFEPKSFRTIISPSKQDEVEHILRTVPQEPQIFQSNIEFKEYLFTPDNVVLLGDNREHLIKRLNLLKVKFTPSIGLEELKDLLEQNEDVYKQNKIVETQEALKHFKEFEDILGIFSQIEKREVPDPPLYLEWNVWRAMVMLNYAQDVKGNFTLDLDGIPLNTARGNLPDIDIEYDNFRLIVEVTTSTGNKQYEMEGEPIARHFGSVKTKSIKPVFCLFIAPKISEGALAHFFNLNRLNTKAYGGKTQIIPFTLKQFIAFLAVAKDQQFNNSQTLYRYLTNLINLNQTAADEEIWYRTISDSVSTWVASE